MKMDDDLELFLEGLSFIVSTKNRLPLKGEKVKDFDVGTHWTRMRQWNYQKRLPPEMKKLLKAVHPLVANALSIKRRISPYEWVKILELFEKQKGRLPLPGEKTDDGYPIGDWWGNRKRRYHVNSRGKYYENLVATSTHAEEALKEGFTRRSMAFFRGIRDYFFENGSPPPASYVRKDGLKLGRWWMFQKRSYRQGKMSDKWKDYLVSLHPLIKEAFEAIDIQKRKSEIDSLFDIEDSPGQQCGRKRSHPSYLEEELSLIELGR